MIIKRFNGNYFGHTAEEFLKLSNEQLEHIKQEHYEAFPFAVIDGRINMGIYTVDDEKGFLLDRYKKVLGSVKFSAKTKIKVVWLRLTSEIAGIKVSLLVHRYLYFYYYGQIDLTKTIDHIDNNLTCAKNEKNIKVM